MSDGAQPEHPPSQLGSRRLPPARVLALAVVIVGSLAVFLIGFSAGWFDRHTIERLIAEPGPSAMVAYIVAVFALELLWCPRMWGLLAGGLVFGPVRGALLSVVADLLSAAFCYLLARRAARDWVDRQLERRPRAHALVRLLAEERGMLTVALLRVLPVHYTAVSYASGLAGVPWRQFVAGTALGVIPGAILYTLVGDAMREPTSPVFLGGIAVWLGLAIGGSWYARRLWAQRAATSQDGSGDGGTSATQKDKAR